MAAHTSQPKGVTPENVFFCLTGAIIQYHNTLVLTLYFVFQDRNLINADLPYLHLTHTHLITCSFSVLMAELPSDYRVNMCQCCQQQKISNASTVVYGRRSKSLWFSRQFYGGYKGNRTKIKSTFISIQLLLEKQESNVRVFPNYWNYLQEMSEYRQRSVIWKLSHTSTRGF